MSWHYTDIWLKHAIRTMSCTLLLVFSVLGCRDSSSSTSGGGISGPGGAPTAASSLGGIMDTLQAGLTSATNEVHQAVAPHADDLQTKTKEEMAKLHQWEYHVEEIAVSAPANEVETRLRALGEERWDCFDLQSRGVFFMVTCKRRPATALSYLKCLSGI